MVGYEEIVKIILSVSQMTTQTLNLSDDFFELVENKKSYSLWIIEPMTKMRSQMILTVEKRGKVDEKYGRITVKKNMINKCGLIVAFHDSKDPTLAFLDTDDPQLDYNDLLKKIIFYCADSFSPCERFGCCHLYRECSIAKKCLHNDLFYARACWYRKNLENGKIFY